MRSIWQSAIAAAAAVGIVSAIMGVSSAYAGKDDHGDAPAKGRSYTVGLFGDVPYGAAGRVEYPRLIADMNGTRLAFSIFDGDLKSGGDGACTDTLYTQSRDWFNSFDNGQVVAKFTRVETFGAGDTHWVAATIDPNDPNLFVFTARMVAANVNDR